LHIRRGARSGRSFCVPPALLLSPRRKRFHFSTSIRESP
jgi:hypothetical protein